jgi:hypothetical protein
MRRVMSVTGYRMADVSTSLFQALYSMITPIMLTRAGRYGGRGDTAGAPRKHPAKAAPPPPIAVSYRSSFRFYLVSHGKRSRSLWSVPATAHWPRNPMIARYGRTREMGRFIGGTGP